MNLAAYVRLPRFAGRAAARALLVLWAWALATLPPLAAAQGDPIVLEAIEDTYAHGLDDTNPQGSVSRVDICPVAMYWIYLKFDLSSIPDNLAAAELRMVRFGGSRPQEISIYFIPDDTWTEAEMTGATRPEPQMPANSDALGAGEQMPEYDRWAPAGLVDLIAQEAAGDGVLSLMLREDPDDQFDVRNYFSKEGALANASRRPRLVLTPGQVPAETLNPNWEFADVGVGDKPAFDFAPDGTLRVMGVIEDPDAGGVWSASAPTVASAWAPQTLENAYIYGPGDLRVAPDGVAHIAWHDHDRQSPVHAAVAPDGSFEIFPIDTPGQHDGWDNALAIDSKGALLMACSYPGTFGAVDSLQWAAFNGQGWDIETVPGSGPFMYGLGVSMALDRQDRPRIAYGAAEDFLEPSDLMLASRSSAGAWTVSAIETGGIQIFPSLALDHWDRPHVAWLDINPAETSNGTVRYAVLNAGVWDIEVIDTLENVEFSFFEARKSVSLVLDDNFRPHVAYGDRRVLKYAVKPFGDWEIQEVASADADLYKGLAVLRLSPERELPAIAFWRRAADGGEGPGMASLARLTGPIVSGTLLR
jgi:hypothetical protein